MVLFAFPPGAAAASPRPVAPPSAASPQFVMPSSQTQPPPGPAASTWGMRADPLAPGRAPTGGSLSDVRCPVAREVAAPGTPGAALGLDPVVASLPIGGTTLGAAADQLSRVALDRDGTATPLTSAASALFDPQVAARSERLFRGMREVVGPGAHLDTVSLASTPEGFVANLVVSQLATGGLARPAAVGDDAYQRMRTYAQEQLVRAAAPIEQGRLGAAYVGTQSSNAAGSAGAGANGHLDVGPAGTDLVRQLLLMSDAQRGSREAQEAGDYASYVIGHELEHARTPSGDLQHVGALEEAVAETSIRAPGRVAEVAAKLGLPTTPRIASGAVPFDAVHVSPALAPFLFHGYTAGSDALTTVLRLAGVDPDDRPTRDAVLQGVPAEQLPAELAARIAAAHPAAPIAQRSQSEIADAIVRAIGDPATLQALTADARGAS